VINKKVAKSTVPKHNHNYFFFWKTAKSSALSAGIGLLLMANIPVVIAQNSFRYPYRSIIVHKSSIAASQVILDPLLCCFTISVADLTVHFVLLQAFTVCSILNRCIGEVCYGAP